MRAGWRRVLLAGGLSAAMVLCTLGLQPLHRALAHEDSFHGPYVGAPASPTIVNLRTAPRGTGHQQPSVDFRTAPRGTGHRQPPILPDLYPGGQARLDREKAAAMQLPPSPGMRPVSAAAPGALAAASLIPGAGFDGIDAAESFCACPGHPGRERSVSLLPQSRRGRRRRHDHRLRVLLQQRVCRDSLHRPGERWHTRARSRPESGRGDHQWQPLRRLRGRGRRHQWLHHLAL
jgi:hypothetical protein